MKIVLSLEAGEIPPSFGIENLNPNIDFEGNKVEVPSDGTIAWPADKLRRASVNSFGFGGANGHCIIDHVNVVLPDYVRPGVSKDHGSRDLDLPDGQSRVIGNGEPGTITPPSPPTSNLHHPIVKCMRKSAEANATTRDLVLLPFSAHNTSSLDLNIKALSQHINSRSLADVAYTLGCKRSKLQQRTFRIVGQNDPATGLETAQPKFASPLHTANIGFVLTGQGAQWPAMGSQLFEYHVFRTTIAFLDHVLHALPQKPSWTIEAILKGEADPERVQNPDVSQPACTAVQIGLIDLLASWSVRPCAVVGHSSGEMAATYASGRMTAAEAIVSAYFRGQAVAMNDKEGAMLAVGMGPEQASSHVPGDLQDKVRVAAINSPKSVTLSGDADAVDEMASKFEKTGDFNRKLRTGGNAYHSHHMASLGGDYGNMLSEGLRHVKMLGLNDSRQRYARVPWASSVIPGETVDLDDDDRLVSYWRANLEQSVRFSDAVTDMMQFKDVPVDVLVEVGPHGALQGPLDQIVKSIGKPASYVSTLKRGQDARESMLNMAGSLFGLNTDIDLVAVNSVDAVDPHGAGTVLTHGCTATDLPPYQYTFGSLNYYESRQSKEYRLRQTLRHDLLGSKIPGCAKCQPEWRNVLRVKDVPWLSDHRVGADAVFPAAGYVAMAIAAASWEHGHPEQISGYSLRNLDIKSMLKLPEDGEGVETIFSMDTANGASSSWAHFNISSVTRDAEDWNEHCSGLIKLEISEPVKPEKMDVTISDPRFPKVRSWYDKFRSIGIGYGPSFQPVSELVTDPDQGIAEAKVKLNPTKNTIEGGESSYPLHPAALDATFQLGLIACHGGQVDKATTAFVPVHLDQLYVRADLDPEAIGNAVAQGRQQGLRGAYLKIQMLDPDGRVALDINQLRCISYNDSANSTDKLEAAKSFSTPYTRLMWKPDFRSLSNEQIRKMFSAPAENKSKLVELECTDMICCLIVAEIHDKLIQAEHSTQPCADMIHWVDWAKRCVTQDTRNNMHQARELSSDERQQLLKTLYQKPGGDNAEAKAARRLHEHMGEIIAGQKTGIDVLVPDDLLTALYQEGRYIIGAYPQLRNVMDCLSFANPDSRILEIGAGTGGATREAMKSLVGPHGIKRYGNYTFTDVSAGFLSSAKETMSEYKDMNFGVFDVEKDPKEQGYEPVYDVVLASEAIHATLSMDKTLANIRKLLKPGGKLVLVESTGMRVLPVLLYGTLTGFWLGINDGRSEGPFMELDVWESKLRSAGFSGVEMHLDDYPAPHNSTSVLVSTRLASSSDHEASEIVTNGMAHQETVRLIHASQKVPPLIADLARELQGRSIPFEISALDNVVEDIKSSTSRIVALLNDENLLLDVDDRRVQRFQHLARNASTMVWLTSNGIVKGRDPRGGLVHGLLRNIGTENPSSRLLSIDIDAPNFADSNEELARGIVDHEVTLQSSRDDESFEDGEFVWQDGCMWVSRLVPDAAPEPYADTFKTPKEQGAALGPLRSQKLRAAFETPGVLNSVYFRPYTELLKPLPHDFIEVEVEAIGVNWKDLGLSSGRFDANGTNLSNEYAGKVTKIGSHVKHLSVGDRVYGAGRGHFGNFTHVPAAYAAKLDPQDDIVEMATMPIVYMTVMHALRNVARIQPGRKVLIQSATGGLGIAAIQFARHKGADVYMTVSSSEKAQFLTETLNVDPSHIIVTSRGDASAITKAARKLTTGFDVILSTVTGGELLYESLKALAPMGHLVDVGRLDVLESKSIGLEVFQKNANFSSFDLNTLIEHDVDLGRELMQSVDQLYREGAITAIRPFATADISDLGKTLQNLAKGTHVGKTVITLQNPSSQVKITQGPPVASFDPSARYVVTGGLGGLGRSMVKWMVDRGARDLLLLSRRGISTPEAKTLVDSLTSQGIVIKAVACNVGKRDDVLNVMREASSEKPIKGIIHAALTLADVSFDKLTAQRWRDGIAAKVQGTCNLHEASLSLKSLDFFLMTTTTETIWAPPTQGAYIAASNFQDLFARYRRRLGLPGSTVTFGLVNDVHSDWRDDSSGTDDMYVRNKALTMTEHQALAALEPAILGISSQHTGKEQDPLSSANLFTCMDAAAMLAHQDEDSLQPRWYRDGRVSHIMRALKDAERQISSATKTDDSGGGGGKSAIALLRADFDAAIAAGPNDKGKASSLAEGAITQAVSRMLFIDEAMVDAGRSVAAHGVDSLTAAELRNWFQRALGVDVKMTTLLDASSSIRGLAEGIVDGRLKT